MTILLGTFLLLTAAINQWNRYFSDFQLALALLALATASEIGAMLIFFGKVRGKPK